MARPPTRGLRYFPFDVGFFEDTKIRLLKGEHGAAGVEIYQRLLCKIYEGSGYYLLWSKDEDYELLAADSGYNCDKVKQIIATIVRRALFDAQVFKNAGVLSSRSVQRRYFEAVKLTKTAAAKKTGRISVIEPELCLLEREDLEELNENYTWLKIRTSEDNSCINTDKSRIYNHKSEIYHTNKKEGNYIIITRLDTPPLKKGEEFIEKKLLIMAVSDMGLSAAEADIWFGGCLLRCEGDEVRLYVPDQSQSNIIRQRFFEGLKNSAHRLMAEFLDG